MSSAAKSKKVEQIKKKALKDLYFFDKNVLGYEDMTRSCHGELCDFVMKAPKQKKLILMPRNSFKSSVVTVGRTLHKLVNDPNHRVLIISETFNQAKTFLREVKNHIEKNVTFRAIFGDLKPPDKNAIWRQTELEIATKTKGKESSVVAVGVGQEQTGMHYPTIICDDILSGKTINTPEQIQKTLDFYRLILSVLSPGGELIIIGTRWSYADLYGHVIDNEDDQFSIMQRAAVLPNGDLYFPELLTEEFLDAQRKAQGSYHFSCQYMNQPVDQENAIFKKKWIKYYKELPCNLRHFMCIDPAGSLDKQADYTAIVVAGIDHLGNIYIRDAIQTRVTISNMMELIFDKVLEYDIHREGCVGLETNAMQITLKYVISEEMNKRNIYFAIKETKAGTTKSKPQRIRSLQPYFEQGKVFLKEDHYDIIDQIIRFPRSKHDDLIDALAYLPIIMIPAEEVVEDKWVKSTLPETHKIVWQQKEEMCSRKVRRTKRY